MSYTALAPYLVVGDNPSSRADISSKGTRYIYRADASTLTGNLPFVGAIWADGLPVQTTTLKYLDRSNAYGELVIETNVNSAADADAGPTLDLTTYTLQWVETERPIIQHPKFVTGGTWALDATAFAAIGLWEYEKDVSPATYLAASYCPRDTYGNQTGASVTVTSVSANGGHYCDTILFGVTVYDDYYPVWTKEGIYKGSTAPGALDIGLVETPSGSGYPTGYKYRKNDDRVTRTGQRAEWKRTESWIGAISIYVDRTHINLSGI
jgi:hypothetical protein